MKKKIYKIMGVALTVMLLSTLAVGLGAAPAGAGTLEWDKEAFPRAADLGDYFRDTGITALGPWAMAIDGTFHAYATGIGMLKSTDSGRSWVKKSPGYGGTAPVDMAISTEDADTLWAASDTGVYRSTNAGGSFTLLTNTDDQGGTISSITELAAGYVDDDPYLFVAATDSGATVPDIFVLGASYGSTWTAMNVPAENIHAIACAPDFNTYSDPLLVAITSTATADAFTMTQLSNGTVGLGVTSGSVSITTTGATTASAPDAFTISSASADSGTITVTAGSVLATPSGFATVAGGTIPVAITSASGAVAWANGAGAGTIVVEASANTTTVTWTTAGVATATLTTDVDGDVDCPPGTSIVVGAAVPPATVCSLPDAIYTVITFNAAGNVATVTATANSTKGTIFPATGTSTDVVSADVDGDATVVNQTSFSLPDGVPAVEVLYKKGGGAWSSKSGRNLYALGPAPMAADMAFPDDFSSSSTSGRLEFFVSIDDGLTTATDGGVYRIIVDTTVAQPYKKNCYSIDLAGDVGDAEIVVGTTTGGAAYSTDGVGETFFPGKPDDTPSGSGNADVIVAQDFLDTGVVFALVDTGEMALSRSTNKGKTWNDISLMDTDKVTVKSLAFGGSDRYMATTPTAGNDSLWKYDGDNWERVTNAAHIDWVQTSPEYDSDSSVFYADLTGNQIYRANDGGDRFREQLGQPGKTMTGWLVVDDSTIIAGVAGKTYRSTNNGTTWSPKSTGLSTAGDIVNFARSPDYDSDSTLLCGDDEGQVFRSTNGGSSYSAITTGTLGFSATSNTFVAFDADYADNGTFYAAGTDGTDLAVERYKDDDEWRSIFSSDATSGYTTTGVTGMAVSTDGTLYLTDGLDTGMFRCLNPTKSPTSLVEWENVTKDCTVQLNGLVLTSGSNKLWGSNAADVWTYVDTMTGAVALSSPSDGADTGRVDSATLAWSAMSGAKQYEIEVNTDRGFKGVDYSPADTRMTSVMVTGLEDGQKYYWKVRANSPILSRWSGIRSFNTALGAPQWNPFVGGVPEAPYNGATNVPLTPSFAWNPADWATGYEFVLAKDAAFSDTVASKTGANALTSTVYLCEEKLANSTTYYWKVRATSKTTDSEWASAVFTTEAKAPAPPAPPAPTPTPPAPEPLIAPIYLWVIIGIGAVLVIALIILIVRTRRVS